MDLSHMFVICWIPDLQNPEENIPTQLFIDPQGFMGIDELSMLRIIDIPHTIKDNNSVPKIEARLGNNQQRKLQALV